MAFSSVSVTGTNRVVALVDMDCFYVQVEERDDPSIKGVPAAVVQYNAYKGGGIIAVNYEARAKGVSRHIRGDEAKATCPEIKLVKVPESRGKADLTKYREASQEVMKVLTDYSPCVERASIDEAYIDLTDAVEARLAELSSQSSTWEERVLGALEMEYFSTNYVMGHDSTDTWFQSMRESSLPAFDDIKLAIGAEIVGKMRDAVYKRTGFRCSAGIAHNKVVAKLVCGINKPNKQTVLPHLSVQALWSKTRVDKVRGLGGKLGEYIIGKLGCVNMSDLGQFSEKQLSAQLGAKTGAWIHQLSLGFDDEPVVPRQLAKSIGCNKNFTGPEALKSKDKVKFWITQLASEVVERIQRDLEVNNRRAKSLTLHVKFEEQNAFSRSCGSNVQYNTEKMAADALAVMEKIYLQVGVIPIVSLGLIASKFEDEIDTSFGKIDNFFKVQPSSSSSNPTSITRKNSSSTVTQVEPCSTNSDSVGSNLCSSSIAYQGNESSTAVCSEQTDVRPTKDTQLKKVNNIDNSKGDRANSSEETASSNPQPTSSARKTFFVYSATAPISISPRKSPRKAATSTVTAETDKPSTSIPASGSVLASTVKECERCGKKVCIYEYASHMDYHFAKDLSREINGLPPLDFDLRPETLRKKELETAAAERAKAAQKRPRGRGGGFTSTSKRGRSGKTGASSSASSSSNSAKPQSSRTIDSYFGASS